MIHNETFALANGVVIPKLGLGTWLIPDDDTARVAREAIDLGYRHIDTAQAYANEHGVGVGLRQCGLSRDQVFITTKLAAECKNYAEAAVKIDESLHALGLEHIDLMLIHSPQPWSDFRQGDRYDEGNSQAWRALEDAYRAGKVRAIGVSNFEQVDLDNLFANGSVAPMVNQVLAHVGNTPFDLIEFCQTRGILVEAYSPVAHGAALADPQLTSLAANYQVSVARLCIRYCLQLGLLPLPKSSKAEHMLENAALDFEISDADMASLKARDEATDYGAAAAFPVFGRKRQPNDGTALG